MRFTVFDTEDNSAELLASGKSGFRKVITQIAAIGPEGKTFYNRGNVIEFLQWLNQTDTGTIYSHNLQYDAGNLFGRALDQMDVKLVDSRLIRMNWRGKLFFDSFNLFPLSAARIGKAFGLEKLAFDPDSREYVFRDCEIIHKAISYAANFAADYGIDTLPGTIGSLAVKVWKSLGGNNWFDDCELSKCAYYGGRVELFRPAAVGRLRYVDVNSLYPAAMLRDFPTALEEMRDVTGYGIAHVKVKIPEMAVAPLPCRMANGEIWYPVGTFAGVWTMAEIQHALSVGGQVLKIYEAYGSKTGFPYYRDFVERLYAERLKADNDAAKLFYKLVLNNLYGQLASRGGCVRSIDISKAPFADGPIYGQKRLIQTSYPLPVHTNYSHAAYVTSYGRIILQEYLRQIDPVRLVYTDTDSIIFQLVKYQRMPFRVSQELGKMKLEAKGQFARCFAPKCYCFDATWKAKGVRQRNAKRFLTTGRTIEESPYRLREAVEFYDRGNSHQLSVWRKFEKHFFSRYTRKRFIKGNGHKPGRFIPKKLLA